MKSKYCIKRCSTFISVIILASVMPLVHGYEQSITAVFKQNPSNPNENKFVNTTPISGFCLVRPGSCTEPGIFSIRVRIGSLLNSPIQANHSSVREGVMFNVPSAWRKVELTSENGDRQEVEVRISGIGVQMEFAQDVQTLKTPPWTSFADAHNNLWHGGGLEYPPGVCRYTSTVAFTARYSNFFGKRRLWAFVQKRHGTEFLTFVTITLTWPTSCEHLIPWVCQRVSTEVPLATASVPGKISTSVT